jgi:hemerythrin
MIKWQESYSTGIEKLDEQHKNLFQYCNDLELGIESGDISKSVLELALRFLERYALGHFGQEETCMHKYACPMAKTNHRAHQEFIEKYTFYQTKIKESDDFEVMLKELHRFLESWLKSHICAIDTKLKECVH